MSPTLQILIAVLIFGISTFFATRLRLTMGKKGGTTYVRDFLELSQLKSKAARAHVNRTVVRMGWVWILVIAPLLTYLPKDGWNLNDFQAVMQEFDLRVYFVILLGCLLLGIIAGTVAYSQVENFDSVEINNDHVDMLAVEQLANMNLRGYDKDEIERMFMQFKIAAAAEAQQEARKNAKGALRKSNSAIFLAVLIVTALVPLVRLLAVWMSGRSTTWFVILAAGFGLLVLMIYGMLTYRF